MDNHEYIQGSALANMPIFIHHDCDALIDKSPVKIDLGNLNT